MLSCWLNDKLSVLTYQFLDRTPQEPRSLNGSQTLKWSGRTGLGSWTIEQAIVPSIPHKIQSFRAYLVWAVLLKRPMPTARSYYTQARLITMLAQYKTHDIPFIFNRPINCNLLYRIPWPSIVRVEDTIILVSIKKANHTQAAEATWYMSPWFPGF